ITTGEEIRRFEMLVLGLCRPQGVSPDGRRVLMRSVVSPDDRGVEVRAGRSVRLLDVETGKELHRFDGHTAAVTSAVFLPDGRFALTSSHDNTMRLWRLPDPPAQPAPEAKEQGEATIKPLHHIRLSDNQSFGVIGVTQDGRYFL